MCFSRILQAREEGHTGYVEGGVVEYSRWIVCAQRSGKEDHREGTPCSVVGRRNLFPFWLHKGQWTVYFLGPTLVAVLVSGLEVFNVGYPSMCLPPGE